MPSCCLREDQVLGSARLAPHRIMPDISVLYVDTGPLCLRSLTAIFYAIHFTVMPGLYYESSEKISQSIPSWTC